MHAAYRSAVAASTGVPYRRVWERRRRRPPRHIWPPTPRAPSGTRASRCSWSAPTETPTPSRGPPFASTTLRSGRHWAPTGRQRAVSDGHQQTLAQRCSSVTGAIPASSPQLRRRCHERRHLAASHKWRLHARRDRLHHRHQHPGHNEGSQRDPVWYRSRDQPASSEQVLRVFHWRTCDNGWPGNLCRAGCRHWGVLQASCRQPILRSYSNVVVRV